MIDLVALTIALQSASSEIIERAWRPEPGTVLERDLEFEVRGGLDEGYVGLRAFGLEGLADVSIT